MRPAIIVDTFGNEKQDDPLKWNVNLVVFMDGMNDGHPSNTLWKTSVSHAEDPKAKIMKAIGDIGKISVMGCQTLVATYKRPEMTERGIITKINTEKEDEFQSKVGLIVKMGSLAFLDDKDAKFGEPVPQVGDWVVFSPVRGFASSIRGVHCRFLQDVHIDAIADNPDDFW